MSHLIIDGYNLIRQVGELARYEKVSLEAARNHLIGLLSQYKKFKHHKITVVFDGILNLSEFASSYKQAGIEVAFSPQGVSADQIIKELSQREKGKAIVVSSDSDICFFVQKTGGTVMRSREFYDKLGMASLMDLAGKDAPEGSDEKPLHKRWLTYKKGPRKKLPKSERRRRQRLKKL